MASERDESEVEIEGRFFDGDGRLRGRRLRGPEIVESVPCSPGRVVRFHANGRLESAELAGPFATRHGILPPGSIVTLDDEGRVVRVVLSQSAVLATKTFDAGATIAFAKDGSVSVFG